MERQVEQHMVGEGYTPASNGGWTGARTTAVGGLTVFILLGLVANIPGAVALQDLLHALSSIGLG